MLKSFEQYLTSTESELKKTKEGDIEKAKTKLQGALEISTRILKFENNGKISKESEKMIEEFKNRIEKLSLKKENVLVARSEPQVEFLQAQKSSLACGDEDPQNIPLKKRIQKLAIPILLMNRIKKVNILYDEKDTNFKNQVQKIKILRNGYISILPNKTLNEIAKIPEPYSIQPYYKLQGKEIIFYNGERLKFEFKHVGRKLQINVPAKNQIVASKTQNKEKEGSNEKAILKKEEKHRLLTFGDAENEIKLCEYETADGEKGIILWSKFMEQGIFLNKKWYESLTQNDKETLVNCRENIFVEFTNETKFKGKWLKNQIFGNGELIDKKNLNKAVKGFWIENMLYFDFEVEHPDDFTDEEIILRAKTLMTPLASSDQKFLKDNKMFKFENQFTNFKTKKPGNFSIAIEGKDVISTATGEEIEAAESPDKKNNDNWNFSMNEIPSTNQNKNVKIGIKMDKTQVLKKIIEVLQENGMDSVKKVKITYPNQDKFSGEIDLRSGFKKGYSKYISHEGYVYEGEFLNNRPFGRGILVDCFNNVKNNFFFDGFVLSSDHGIEQAYDKAKADKISDYEFYMGIKHPELGRGRFEGYGVNYNTFIFDIEKSKRNYQKMIEDITDGEQDYGYNWEDETYDQIVDILTEIKLSKEESKTLLNGGEDVEKIKKDDFDFLEDVKTADDVEKMDEWKKNLIIEVVKDQEFEDFKKIYENMKAKNLVFELFNIKNNFEQNLLQIAAKFGYRQFFIDMLTAAKVCRLTRGEMVKLLGNRDGEYNNLLDLACIKGYDLQEELFYCKKILRNNPNTKEEEYVPLVFIQIEEILFDIKRELFTYQFITSERIFDTIQEIKDSKQLNTNELSFLTKRAICLKAFFYFIENYSPLKESTKHSKIATSVKVMKELLSPIDQNSHTPLHFTLYHADLHSTLMILQKVPMLIFRQRKPNPKDIRTAILQMKNKYIHPHKRQFFGAHDSVFFSKSKWKSMSIFISILKEINKIFNYEIIKDYLICEIDDSDRKAEINVEKIKKKRRFFRDYDPFKGMFNKMKLGLALKDAVQNKARLGKNLRIWKNMNELQKEVKKEVTNQECFERVEKIAEILHKTEFKLKNIDLYKNEYILLSEELCKSYITKERENMSAYHLQMKSRYSQNLTPNDISPFEVTQKLIIEFMPDSLFSKEAKRYLSKEKLERLIDNTLQLVTWYLTFLGDSPVNPEIFRKFKVEIQKYFPLGEKNLIHIMCENNSYLGLERILEFNRERKLRKLPWMRKMNPKVWRHFVKDTLTDEATTDSWNTPAHICVMNQSEECLDLLCKYDALLEVFNRSGHTAKDLLRFNNNEMLKNSTLEKVDKIEQVVVEHMANLIKLTCKTHTVKYQEKILENMDHKELLKEEFQENYNELNVILEKNYHDMLSRQWKIQGEMEKKGSKLMNANEAIEFDIPIINSKEYLTTLFDIDVLSKIPKFKYSKFEKQYKKIPLKAINSLDFNKPINSEYKPFHHTDDYLYIQILIEKSKDEELELENNLVIGQMKNLKERYSKFKNGLRLYLIKGLDVTIREKKRLYLCPKHYNSWFLVAFFSDELLFSCGMEIGIDLDYLKLSYNDRMRTKIGDEFLEKVQVYRILNSHQKMRTVRHMIEEEFNIDSFKKKNLINDYGLIHNYWLRENTFKEIDFNRRMTNIGNYYSQLESYSSYLIEGYTVLLIVFSVFLVIALLLSGQNEEAESVVTSIIMTNFGCTAFFLLNSGIAVLRKNLNEKEDFDDNDMNPEYRGQNTIDYFSNNITKGNLAKKSKWRSSSDFRYFFFSVMFSGIIFMCNMVIIEEERKYSSERQDKLKQDGISTEEIDTINTELRNVGILISVLNFIISTVYSILIEKIIQKINFKHSDHRDSWIFIYGLVYEITASVFTLFMKAFFSIGGNRDIIQSQMSSIMLTSILLNLTFGLIIPVMQFAISRYNFSGWFFNFLLSPCCCFLCCRGKLRGRIEKFKKNIVEEFKKNPKTTKIFSYYVLGKPLEESDESKSGATGDLSELSKLNGSQEPRTNFSAKVRRLEQTVLSTNYKHKIDERIFKKHDNIKTRLKEAFYNYVLLFEKIEESTYMINIEELQSSMIKTIVVQYTYIIAFSFFAPTAALLCLAMSILVGFSLRSSLTWISKRKLAQKKIFNFVSLGIQIFNLTYWFGLAQLIVLLFQRYSAELLKVLTSPSLKYDPELVVALTLSFFIGGNFSIEILAMSWISSRSLQNPERLPEGKRQKHWDDKKEFDFFMKIWKENVIGDLDDKKTRYVRDKFLAKGEKYLGEFLQNTKKIENEQTKFGNVHVDFVK